MSPSDTSRPVPPDLPTASPEEAGMDSARLSRIGDAFQSVMNDGQLSGGVVLVARRGKVVYEHPFGYRATVPEQEKATLDTIYDMASLTKPIATASAVMKLVEEGRLRLSDSVATYIPEWKASDEESTRVAEAARVKRLLAQARLDLSPETLFPQETTTVRTLERLARKGEIHLSPRGIDELLQIGPPSRKSVQLRHLITHTAGLDPFDRYYLRWPEGNALERIIDDIATRPLLQAPGEKFVYSDLGFITLGEIVQRVSGKSLAAFCHDEVFAPLGMNDTMFCPPAELRPRIAPTEFRTVEEESSPALKGDVPTTYGRSMARGRVHDENAAVIGGISGHAGLFSTVRDLSRYCQMMLNGGEYGGVRIFSPLTVRAMTTDQAHLKDGDQRGYGWDLHTSYSVPRGDIFQTGYGHTGWTGTSIWVVPEEKLFIIILTNRVHPDGSGEASAIRARVANIVAASIVESDAPADSGESR